MKQQKGRKRAAALCLAGALAVSLAGCGFFGDKGGLGGAGSQSGSDDSAAMGRYVETMIDVDIGEIIDLQELSDGRLVLLGKGGEGRWISGDGGATWEPDGLLGWNEFVYGKYVDGNILDGHKVYDMKAAPDGSSVAVLYRSYDFMGGEYTDESAENRGIWLIPAQGEEKQIELSLGEEEMPGCLCFSEDGSRLFMASTDQKIYEIDREAGTAKLFFEADIIPDVFCAWENYMALKSERDGVVLYRLDTKERIEDNVITDFVKENCVVNNTVVESTYSIFPAEEESLYLVCSRGVYRHVIGGTVMEQVINGGLTSFIDPMKHVAKMIQTEEEGFLVAFSEGKLSAFVYDPNISTVPSQSVTAYSLTESDILRQAIIRYQGEHPDIYVEYKVGMDQAGSVTREDAVKKLNTEIMAGKGPDLLVLDGLPTDSYKEKGVLLDISPYLADLETKEPLLANIKESFTEDGKITMIPAAVTLPMYYTEQENMTDVSDLSALADLFEKLRKDHPGEELMELYNKDMLFDAVFPVSAPNWVTASGEPDMERISGDLEQMKRIYDACMEGLPDQVLMRYGEVEHMRNSDKATAYNDLGGGAVRIAGGILQVSMGALTNGYNYMLLQSVRHMEGKKDNRLAQMPGSAADVFTPVALMGINAASQKSDLAGDFMQMILSKEMQSMIYPIGFPVNEEGLELYLESLGGYLPESQRKPGVCYGMFRLTDDDGQSITMTLYVPTEEEAKEICDTLKTVHTPYLQREALEDAVREAAEKYFDGICSLEETMDVIREKSKIIMAE